jgi:membrane associated rhomboid family serine protease
LKYRAPDSRDRSITIWLPDSSAADRLVAVLPKQRTSAFRAQLQEHAKFEQSLIAQSPETPVTIALVAINVLVFLVTAIAGGGWLLANGSLQVVWGSNFGPYTTDGEWWRLLTSLFIHFGIVHLVFNMWALASFGPLIERLFGSVNYLFIYLIAGATGSLASISWRPDINSALRIWVASVRLPSRVGHGPTRQWRALVHAPGHRSRFADAAHRRGAPRRRLLVCAASVWLLGWRRSLLAHPPLVCTT